MQQSNDRGFFSVPVQFVAAGLTLFCCSCGDDPDLVAEWEKQQEVIAEMRQELDQAQALLTDAPSNLEDELAKMEAEIGVLASDAQKHEVEIAELREERTALDQKYADYRKKYPIN